MSYRTVLVWSLGLLGGGALLAQQQPVTMQTVPGVDLSQMGNLPVQKIEAGDLIGVTVFDAPEFTHTYRVTPQGAIRMPMLKDQIKVDGLLPDDIERLVAEALEREKILV